MCGDNRYDDNLRILTAIKLYILILTVNIHPSSY